jgi:hypothetical protein
MLTDTSHNKFNLVLCSLYLVQVEVLNQQLSTAEEQHKVALAALHEQKRQLADSKLALTGQGF